MADGYLGIDSDYKNWSKNNLSPLWEALLATDYGKDLLHRIASDPKVAELRGKKINYMYTTVFHDQMFICWAVWTANKFGIEFAEDRVKEFISNQEIELRICVGVSGVKVDQPIDLFHGITLEPVSKDHDGMETYDGVKAGTNDIPELNPVHSILMYKKILNVVDPDKNLNINPIVENDITESMNAIAHMICMLPGFCCIPITAFNYIPEIYPYGVFNGQGRSFKHHDFRYISAKSFDEDEVILLKSLFDAFQEKSQTEKVRWKTISQRLANSKIQISPENKFLDLGITAEMMLLSNNTDHQQLSLSFKLRGAWLIGSDERERKDIATYLKELYTYRSQVAHTGMLHRGNQAKINAFSIRYPIFLEIIEKIGCKIIISGEPEWDDLILGFKS